MRRSWTVTCVRALAVASAIALVSASTALAANDRYALHLTDDGQALARDAILSKADLGASGWTAGKVETPSDPAKKPDQNCGGFHPKRSDLVLNGSAGVVYMAEGGVLRIDSRADVFQTPRMVRLDGERTLQAPGLLKCLGKLATTVRLVSSKRMKVPRLGSFAVSYRMLLQASNGGRFHVDLLYVGVRRTEITLVVNSPPEAGKAMAAAELNLARILIARAR